MRTLRHALFWVLVLVSMPQATRADLVDDAYDDFLDHRFGRVFHNLFAYRFQHEGTLRVDFMLAVSACHIADVDFKALGGVLLAAIPNWYGPLRPDHAQDVQRWSEACPWTGISEEQAIARLEGKSDWPQGAAHLARERSDSGKDQPLPPAPMPSADVVVPPPPPLGSRGMGPLMEGQGFMGGTDYRSTQVASAAECAALCENEDACKAMTFIISQKMCWLKNALTATAATPDMVSAVKQ